jgi:hypothetical protein
VEQALSTLLKQRSDEHHALLACNARKPSGAGPRNGLSKVEQVCVFPLAKILGAKQFRQANHARAMAGRLTNLLERTLEILFRIRSARHLH